MNMVWHDNESVNLNAPTQFASSYPLVFDDLAKLAQQHISVNDIAE